MLASFVILKSSVSVSVSVAMSESHLSKQKLIYGSSRHIRRSPALIRWGWLAKQEMPKKRSLKKKKNASEERVPEALQENLPLPQVWLTVQPGLEQDELRVIGSQADLIETKPVSKHNLN